MVHTLTGAGGFPCHLSALWDLRCCIILRMRLRRRPSAAAAAIGLVRLMSPIVVDGTPRWMPIVPPTSITDGVPDALGGGEWEGFITRFERMSADIDESLTRSLSRTRRGTTGSTWREIAPALPAMEPSVQRHLSAAAMAVVCLVEMSPSAPIVVHSWRSSTSCTSGPRRTMRTCRSSSTRGMTVVLCRRPRRLWCRLQEEQATMAACPRGRPRAPSCTHGKEIAEGAAFRV